ncbi:hypothetical protein FRB94_009187 [Tulasnella sp. JGI-2019a]|nr:hypothetical protein FRB94_009187 [Tulasnella sp. JGI-2019a]
MTSVERDIEAYFKEELPVMAGPLLKEYVVEWLGEERCLALARKSQGLFIYATTTARVLADRNVGRDPEKQLGRLLSFGGPVHPDDIYRQVMNRVCPETIEDDILTLFRSVLGALVVAEEPLNTYTLASLLCSKRSEQPELSERLRMKVLRYLQAVFIVPGVDTFNPAPNDQPIRFIHASCIDYLTDSSRCDPRFRINVTKEHERMAIRCFHGMRDLKPNICDLDPSPLNSEVEDFNEQMQKHMPPGLRYACMHVAAHVSQAPINSGDVEDSVKIFAKVSLMTWLEVLGLMGRTNDAVGMASLMELWFKSKPQQNSPPSQPPSYLIDFFGRLILHSDVALISVRSAQATSGALPLQNLKNVNSFVAGILHPASGDLHRSAQSHQSFVA